MSLAQLPEYKHAVCTKWTWSSAHALRSMCTGIDGKFPMDLPITESEHDIF